MRFIFSIVFLLFSVSLAFAQIDGEQASMIRQDFRDVAVVADIEITKVEIIDQMGTPKENRGYTFYRFTGTVKESFKGGFKTGEEIIFSSVIEGQPSEESLSKNYIRFLERSKKKDTYKTYFELENSRRPTEKEVISILRRLKR
jgi:hypothetical protein